MALATDPFEPVVPKTRVSSDAYNIHGIEYPRVTRILSVCPGHHLMPWYAKQTALAAASLARQLGAKNEDPILDDFEIKRAPFHGDPADAKLALTDWASLMREPERYRDYRGWVGSAVHHVRYDWALGVRVLPNEFIEYAEHLVRVNGWIPEGAMARFEELGKDIVRTIAFEAHARWGLLRPWYEAIDPEFEVNGLETCVYHSDEMYAGTMDGIWATTKEKWERTGQAWPGGSQPKARFLEDLKNSKSLSNTVALQMAAYVHAEKIHLKGDNSDHPMVEEIDAMVAVHCSMEEMRVKPKVWFGADAIDQAHEAFCHVNSVFRFFNDMPKAVRSRVARQTPTKTRRGERDCPF
jgi:hypothetical protein